jgi:hypothetical protein
MAQGRDGEGGGEADLRRAAERGNGCNKTGRMKRYEEKNNQCVVVYGDGGFDGGRMFRRIF